MRKYIFPHSLVELVTSSSSSSDSQKTSTSSTSTSTSNVLSDEGIPLLLQLRAFFDSYLQESLLPTLRSDAPAAGTTAATGSVKNTVNILYGSTFQSM
jgi:hypothetical protein